MQPRQQRLRRTKGIVLALFIVLSGCNSSSHSRVSYLDDCALVDIQFLGEYYTPVSGVILQEAGGRVIWEATVSGPEPAGLHVLRFCLGENAREPYILGDTSSLEYRIPNSGDTFELRRDTDYLVRIESPRYRSDIRAELRFDTGDSALGR